MKMAPSRVTMVALCHVTMVPLQESIMLLRPTKASFFKCDSFKGPTHPSKKRLGGHSCHTAKVFHAMSSPAAATGWAAFVEYPTMVYLKASWSKIQPPQKKKDQKMKSLGGHPDPS